MQLRRRHGFACAWLGHVLLMLVGLTALATYTLHPAFSCLLHSLVLNLSDFYVSIGMTVDGLGWVPGAPVGSGGAFGLPLGRPRLAESWQKHG